MTEFQPQDATAIPKGQIASLAAAKYLKLLFIDGSDAWKPYAGNYKLSVIAAPDRFFDQKDMNHCRKLFEESFRIHLSAENSQWKPHMLDFIITPQDLEFLKEKGLGKNNIGTLLENFETKHIINETPQKNASSAVLATKLRLGIADEAAWKPVNIHPAYSYQCTLLLPYQLAGHWMFRPDLDSPDEAALKQAVRDNLQTLLPSIAVGIGVHGRSNGMEVQLNVDDSNYEKIRIAIAAANDLPLTNVQSFEQARARLRPTFKRE